MRIYGKRDHFTIWPLRFNKAGLFRFTSITVDLVFWRAVLWERKRRR